MVGKYSEIVIMLYLQYLSFNIAELELPTIEIMHNRVVSSDNLYARSDITTNVSLIEIQKQNEQTIYVIPHIVVEITVSCNASYPVTWNFQQSQISNQAFDLLDVTSRRSVVEIFDSKSFNYSTQLHFFAENNKLTGNYVCSSAARSDIQSNVFMYWEGTSPPFFINSQENITVYLENGVVVLPCIVSKPDAPTPGLLKETQKDKFDKLRLNKNVSYNPQIGFTLTNVQDPNGTYKCFISDDDFVFVNVKIRNETAVLSNRHKGNFTYNPEKMEVVCCSNSQRPPNIHMFYCRHASSCAFRKHSEYKYYAAITRLKKSRNCAIYQLKHYDTGVLKCVGDGIETYKEFIKPIRSIFTPWHFNFNITVPVYFSWEEIDPQSMLEVISVDIFQRYVYYNPRRFNRSAISEEVFYSGERKMFSCRMSTYYFSEGLQWAIKWKNSTLTLFKSNHTNANVDHFYDRHNNMETPLNVLLDKEMEAVICFAPVWNSSVWVPKSKYLYVNDSVSPIFLNETLKLDQLNWMVNKTHLQINCSARGVPPPTISWQKDNVKVANGTNRVITYVVDQNTSTSVSVLTVLRVSYHSSGKYMCNATNFGGFVLKSFNVTVMENKSWTSTLIIVFSVIVIFFLLIGLTLIYRKMDRDKKAIERLTTVAFKDVATRQEAVGIDVHNSMHNNGRITNNLLD